MKKRQAVIPEKLARRWKAMIQRSYVKASKIGEWSSKAWKQAAKALPASKGPFVDDL